MAGSRPDSPHSPPSVPPDPSGLASALSPLEPLRCRTTTLQISPNGQAPHASTFVASNIYRFAQHPQPLGISVFSKTIRFAQRTQPLDAS